MKRLMILGLIALGGCKGSYVPNQPDRKDVNKSVAKVCNRNFGK